MADKKKVLTFIKISVEALICECYIVSMEKGKMEKDDFPGKPTSVWLDTTPDTYFGALKEDLTVDICVVGGGMAGLMIAYMLFEAGYKVAVLEAGKIVEDVTARTTAKITSQHGDIYRYLIKNFGEARAKMYADANQAGLRKVVSIIIENKVDCDLMKQSAYLYTEKYRNVPILKKEAESAGRLGLQASFTENTPLDFIKGAVEFKNQAQFHPRKFLLFLAKKISGNGFVFENTRALNIKDGEVITDKGSVRAKKIVVATHFPFYDKSRFYAKLFPHRSYVLGLKLKSETPEGMYFSIDGDRNTIRSYYTGKESYLLVGGGTEKAGEDTDTLKHYEEVGQYAKARFKIDRVEYHWFTQDNRTADKVPYIGKMPNTENVYVATGFGGWGMTTSAVSAIIISDLILGRVNPWISLFDPARKGRIKSAKMLLGENARLASHLLRRRFRKHPFELPTGFEEGEGKIIKVKGKKVAVYKDKNGAIHAISPKCTHMGCTVNWNNVEKTWDCPCHGSRYNYDGKVIHGPAQKDLKKEEI